MTEKRTITCINCPIGCEVELSVKNGEIKKITGNRCPRGEEYVREEFLNPTRILTTTVKVKNGKLPVIPVKSNKPLPKKYLEKAMDEISKKEIKAPVKIHDVVIKNIFDTGVDIVTSRSLDKNR